MDDVMYDIDHLRQAEFPLSAHHLFFNHASISPLPQRTRLKMQWVIDELARQPMEFWMEQGLPMTEAFKRELAAFINAHSPEEIVPVTTTSAALNAVAQSIAWLPGDNLIFCEIEFPANAYPWMSLERDGVDVRLAPAVDGGLTLEALEPLVDKRTRLVAVSAIQFFSGHRTDLAAIGAFCREHNALFVVDAIQAIGHMRFDVRAMHIDVLATGGQKSLLAAPGTGFMFVRQALAESLRPRIIGANATRDYLHWLAYDLTPLAGAERFASGTPNIIGMFAVLESLSLLRELGVTNIDQHTTALSRHAAKAVQALGYEVVTPQPAPGPIVTFCSRLSSENTDALVLYLARHDVSVVKHLDAAGVAYLRLSFHCYNTFEEIDRFAEILQKFVLNREHGSYT